MNTQELAAAIERMWRRILLAVGRGRTTAVNDSGAVQVLQVKLSDLELRDNTPRIAEYGFTSNPPAGTDAVLLFIAGDRSNGLVIATNHQASRLRNLQPGEAAIFDNQGQSIWIKRGGIVIEGHSWPVTVNTTGAVNVNAASVDVTAPEVTITATSGILFDTPLLSVTGDILDNA